MINKFVTFCHVGTCILEQFLFGTCLNKMEKAFKTHLLEKDCHNIYKYQSEGILALLCPDRSVRSDRYIRLDLIGLGNYEFFELYTFKNIAE